MNEIREQAESLRKQGLTYKQIVSTLDGAVSVDWCKRNLKSTTVSQGDKVASRTIVDQLISKASSEFGCTNKEALKIAENVFGFKISKDRLRYLKDLARKEGVDFIKPTKAIRKALYQPVNYYVYAVEVAGIFIYIGKGYKARWEHTISGTSHVYELNRLHFHGKGVTIVCLLDGLDSRQDHWFEQSCILKYQPEFNIRGSGEVYNTESYELEEAYHVIYNLK